MKLAYACYQNSTTFAHAQCKPGNSIIVHGVGFGAKNNDTNCAGNSTRDCCQPMCADCLIDLPDLGRITREKCNGLASCVPAVEPTNLIGCERTNQTDFMALLYECVPDSQIDQALVRDNKQNLREFLCDPSNLETDDITPYTGNVTSLGNSTWTLDEPQGTGALIGATMGGVFLICVVITMIVGLFCCRDRSPCKTMGDTIRRHRSQREKQQDKKRLRMLQSLGYTKRRSPRSICRMGSLQSSNSDVRLVSRDTYDGLTVVDKIRCSNSAKNVYSLASSTISDTSSSSPYSDVYSPYSVYSGRYSGIYSLIKSDSSTCIDKSSCSIRTPYSTDSYNFSPLFNRSIAPIPQTISRSCSTTPQLSMTSPNTRSHMTSPNTRSPMASPKIGTRNPLTSAKQHKTFDRLSRSSFSSNATTNHYSTVSVGHNRYEPMYFIPVSNEMPQYIITDKMY